MHKISERKQFYWELIGSLFLLLICFGVQDYFRAVNFHTFMRRDIDRALEVIAGHAIFFGPETSGGGYLPGPFLYYLLAAALKVVPKWQAAFALLLQLLALACLGGWFWLKRRYDVLMGALFLVLVSYSHPLRGFTVLFLNVSYLLPFALFAILLTVAAFSSEQAHKRDRAMALSAVCIGLGLQLHFSIACLAVAQTFLFLAAARLELKRPSPRAAFQAVAILLVTCSPFLFWWFALRFGIRLGQPGSYMLGAAGALKTLAMLAGYSFQVPWQITLQESALRVFDVVPMPLVAALMTTASLGWPRAVRPANERALRILVVIAAWGFFPFSYVFLVHMGRRYGMVFCFSLLLIAIEIQSRLIADKKATSVMNAICAAMIFAGAAVDTFVFRHHLGFLVDALGIGATVLGLGFWALRRRQHAWASACNAVLTVMLLATQFQIGSPHVLREKQLPRFHNTDWTRIWRVIVPATGWRYEEAMRRIYFVNLRLDEDPKPTFDDARASLDTGGAIGSSSAEEDEMPPEIPRHQTKDSPDGYFVINAKSLRQRRRRTDLLQFLQSQRIPPEIKKALREGSISLGKFYVHGVAIVPYFTRSRPELPIPFHDLGEGYERSASSRSLDVIQEPEGTRSLGPGHWLFKWNECGDKNLFCNVGAEVRLLSQTPPRVDVEFKGSAISQNSPWVSPAWTQAWLGPYVEVKCGGRSIRKLVSESIGMRRQFGSNEYNELLQSNNSIVAPISTVMEFGCERPIEQISVGRSGSVVDQLTQTLELPAKAQAVAVPQNEIF